MKRKKHNGFTPLQIKKSIQKAFNNYKSRYRKGKFVTGFTLLELLIACGVLIVALCGLLLLFNYCYALAMQAGHTTMATAGAYGKLEEIRNYDYTGIISNYNGTTFTIDGLEQFNGNGAVTVAYVDGTNYELLQVNIDVNWQERGNRTLTLPLASLIAKKD